MLSYLRKSKLAAKFILMIFAFSLIGVTPAPAQEQYPAVARLSFVSGPVTYSRGDDPDEWDDAVENVPLTIGDRIYAPEDGRAELQISSGNFVRLAPRSYLSTLNLSDDVKQFYLGEGAASFNIKRLQSDEVIEIDTPNVSVTLEEPGQYRVAVDDDGNSRVTVRRGRVTVAASGRQIAVENSEIRVYGIDSPRYEIVGLPATDAFDRWVSERNDRFERSYSDAYRYASEDIIGAEDLAEYGRWEEIPDYGYAWTPSRVAAGWAPFSNGRWYWQDPWGWSWISNERWGWATSHYGRWTPHRSRWYWVPVRPRTRVRYAPAVVEFVRVRDHVGWFPLHPRDRHVPWWERRDRQRFDRNVTYVNRTHVTVVNHNTFITARPVNKYIVRDSVIIRDARSARFTESLPIPNRSSLRIVSDNGARRGHRPSDKIVNRVAVVRTAVPASPRRFQDKLPEIQKNQGKAVEPARILAAARDDRATNRVRVRPAAEADRGDFAPRNPGVNAGPASQPLTAARGKKLATREESAADRAQKTPALPSQPEPSKGTASRPESPRVEQDRERQRQEKPTPEREPQAQQQREIERKKQAQEEERKAQSQKQQQDRERQAQEQKQRELERRQAQQKEEQRKAQAQKQPAERRQEPQERQSAQQRLEELERRQAQQREVERKAQLQKQQQERERQQQLQERQLQQQRQQDLERKAQVQQQQQEQARREQQLRQQQAQERQARDQQRQQQEVERRQQQQQRDVQSQQRQEQARAQQLRQQQAQAQREAQQAQRQQEQERRPQPRQPQPQERPTPQPQPQAPRQPGQF